MSYMSAPRDHQSTALAWPVRVRISGAMYSMVPQNVWVTESSWRNKTMLLFSFVRAMYWTYLYHKVLIRPNTLGSDLPDSSKLWFTVSWPFWFFKIWLINVLFLSCSNILKYYQPIQNCDLSTFYSTCKLWEGLSKTRDCLELTKWRRN